MVALTIVIGGAVLVVLLVAATRALRRASRQIDDIIREELDERGDD
jgi:multisubunit Na+/H+ antiporter MnhC subunit